MEETPGEKNLKKEGTSQQDEEIRSGRNCGSCPFGYLEDYDMLLHALRDVFFHWEGR